MLNKIYQKCENYKTQLIHVSKKVADYVEAGWWVINKDTRDPITLDSNYEKMSKSQTRAEGDERTSEILYHKHTISGYMNKSSTWMLSL